MSWLTRIDISHELVHEEHLNDNYAWHKKLWDLFTGYSDSKRDFLTRIDPSSDGYRVYIVSQKKPTKPLWCPEYAWAVKMINEEFFNTRYFRFDIKANPTKCISCKNEMGKLTKRGKRIALVNYGEQNAWLRRKADQNGFSIFDDHPVQIGQMQPFHFHKDGHSGYHIGVRFIGILTVVDKEKFKDAFYKGLGSAKAFGFGMIMLQPVNI